jgi:TolB-like protein
LNATVARLRAALGDSADRPRFIETLPKRGYRFIGRLAPAVREPQPLPARRARIMVLPFANLSGDPAREYFSDAMTDSIITELAAAAPEDVAVIARTTAMRYRASRQDVTRVGRELNVDYIVEGAVWQTEDRVTINVKLVQVDDHTHLFARRYEAATPDLFDVHRAIAHEVSSRIGGVRTVSCAIDRPDVSARPTEDQAAYHAYLRGRHELQKFVPESLASARRCTPRSHS